MALDTVAHEQLLHNSLVAHLWRVCVEAKRRVHNADPSSTLARAEYVHALSGYETAMARLEVLKGIT